MYIIQKHISYIVKQTLRRRANDPGFGRMVLRFFALTG